MRKVIENFERKDLVELYTNRANPFSFVTIKLDITNAYNYSRVHKHLYQLLCYTFTKAMNKVENFKYRLEDGKVVYYDIINPNWTERLDNGNVSFIECDMSDTFEEHLIKYEECIKEFKEKQDMVFKSSEGTTSVWMSCLPWFSFNSIIPPFDSSEPIPQLIWDKYQIEGEKVFVNLMIMSHHAFVDGVHMGMLIEEINKELDRITV